MTSTLALRCDDCGASTDKLKPCNCGATVCEDCNAAYHSGAGEMRLGCAAYRGKQLVDAVRKRSD